MKKILSFILVFAMICSLCPVLPFSGIMTASAASDTFFWGFDDNVKPSIISLNNITNPTYSGGIFTAKPATNDPMVTINQPFAADEVNQLRVRMRYDLIARTDQKPRLQMFFSVDNGDGTSTKLNGNYSFYREIALTTDGEFVTYTLDLDSSKNSLYAGDIAYVRVDPVNCEGELEIDYIMLTKTADDIYSWDFDSSDDTNVWKLSGDSGATVSNGLLNFPQHDTVIKNDKPSPYDITLTYVPATAIKAANYEYVEVIMKHDLTTDTITTSSDRNAFKLYIVGTAYDSDGTAIEVPIKEGNKKLITLSETSGESFYRYTFPLSGTLTNNSTVEDISTMDISKMRLDPINAVGSFAIDSIRIVPVDVVYNPLDKTKMSLSYTFANNDAGCAKGTIKLDFGEQNSLLAKNVELMWASGNATDGYTALAGYSSITTKTGDDMSKGYVISRPLYIPEGTTALIARVTDVENTFDLVVDIPSTKVLEKSEPKFVAALSSDYHFGNNISLEAPHEKLYTLKNHVEANADALLVAGDFIQYYGVRDKNEYYHLEYLAGDETYASYAEYDPTALPSQWDMAMEYYQSWNIPVFIIEGNHETPSAGRLAKGHTGKYMKDWMTKWVNYTNNQSMYDEFTEREKHIYENTYEYSTNYDNYVTAADGTRYHVIGVRNLHMGNNKLTAQELNWLDKKLYESEATGTPTFVMLHVPVKGTVIAENDKHANDFNATEFNKIIAKHPDTIVVSGHTHYSLYSDYQFAVNGEGISPSYVHAGGVDDTAVYHADTNTNDSTNYSNCEIVYAEIYEDRIVTRAYDVVKGQYIATNTNQITLKPETTIEDISVSRVISEDSVTLTASSKTDGVSYQWYVGGEAVAAGASVTVDAKCGEFVAVRATDATGSFRSESFDSVYDDRIVDEERTYHLSASDADGYNSSFTNVGLTTNEWISVAGKADNVLHMAYNNDTTPTKRVYLNYPRWTQKNENSKYLVIKFNTMPLNSDTRVYIGVKNSSALTPRVLMTPNEWSNVTVVWDIANNKATQYINGEFYKTTTCDNFMVTPADSEKGILRLCIATINDSTFVNSLDAYIDDFEVYETVNAPVIAPVCDMVQPEVSGNNAYSAENKLAYVPAGTTTKALSQAFWCVVVDANGATKASDAKVADTDRLMYHAPVTGSYNYYSVKIYTDYESLFINGAIDGKFTASDVKLYVNAKTAGDTVVVAQYDGEDDLVTAQYKVCEAAGLNEITFTKDADTSYATVFVWDSITNIKPLVDVLDILVK